MTPQSTFMIVAPIRDGQLEGLKSLLATMNNSPGHADPENHLIPFGRFDRLHFARFVIIEAKTAHEIKAFGVTPRPWRPTLSFWVILMATRIHLLLILQPMPVLALKTFFLPVKASPRARAICWNG